MSPTPASTAGLESDACYLAMKAHDARFDGSFFTGVTSTGVYCRPVCRVKLPRRENCCFFRHAAQAEAAGFRPCLRCRPELAPRAASWSTEDASRILALQAARLIDEPDAWAEDGPGAARIAARLGVSDRHLRRIFETQFGVSPLQYLQTRRLLAAKQLIADTRLPMTQVALASGFASVRRFNAAFLTHYGLNPSALRRAGATAGGREDASVTVRLGFRPPYDSDAMLDFFRRRALRGVEALSDGDRSGGARQFARTLRVTQGGRSLEGWLQLRFDPQREQVLLRVGDSLAAVLPTVISRVRAMFDLDAEPMAINSALHASFPFGDGLRVPGTVDGFELAVRAVLGQQITVAAARTLGTRLVQAFGEPIATPIEGLDRLFPTPAAIAGASGDALAQTFPQVVDLALGAGERAGRIDDHVGDGEARLVRHLRGDAGRGIRFTHTPQLHEPPQPDLGRRVRHDDQLPRVADARLHEQGHVVDDDGPLREVLGHGEEALGGHRVSRHQQRRLVVGGGQWSHDVVHEVDVGSVEGMRLLLHGLHPGGPFW